MRSLLVALSLFLTAHAWAEGDQAEDDEKPGTRTRVSNKGREDDIPLVSDTPPATPPVTRTDEAPPPTRSTKQLSREAPRTDGPGDRPADPRLSLKGRKGEPAEVEAGHTEGAYAGVSLGGQGLPPHPPRLPIKGTQRMTWPGFQVRDGVPTVFLQTTGTPDYAVSDSPGAIRVTLRGTKIQLRNNSRPLKVAEFGTAVTEVSAKTHGRDVVVTIKHKGQAGHRERVEPSAGGFQLLVVELGGK